MLISGWLKIPLFDIKRFFRSDDQALELLEQYYDGKITIDDLMGPLTTSPNLTAVFPTPAPTSSLSAPEAEFYPMDEHNKTLLSHVHPSNFVNPSGDAPYDVVVIGAGVAGLLSVITAKWLGKRAALVEKHAMGGDCLNIGCVPSKALIAAANALHTIKSSSAFGITVDHVSVDFGAVMERLRAIRAKIAPHDSVARYAAEFCDVYIGAASFVSSTASTDDSNSPPIHGSVLVVGDDGSQRLLSYCYAMIATGASAAIPPVLTSAGQTAEPSMLTTNSCEDATSILPHLTNASFFNLTELPPRLFVLGSGPIGLEMAQAMCRLGSHVTVAERGARLLMKEDADAAAVVMGQMKQDGVTILTNATVTSIKVLNYDPTITSLYHAPWPLYEISITTADEASTVTIQCEAILNATGRKPNVQGLNLEQVDVSYSSSAGVNVDDSFATSNPYIFATGDVCSAYKFTHAADFQARIAIRNMFLGTHYSSQSLLIPWCTYTSPEIAHVGKYQHELDQSLPGAYEVYVKPLAGVDRCLCDNITSGFVKILVAKEGGRVLGATIVGPHAGDMISELTLCIQNNISITQLAGTIHPYPTTQESVRLTALQHYQHYKKSTGLPIAVLQRIMKDREEGNTKEN